MLCCVLSPTGLLWLWFENRYPFKIWFENPSFFFSFFFLFLEGTKMGNIKIIVGTCKRCWNRSKKSSSIEKYLYGGPTAWPRRFHLNQIEKCSPNSGPNPELRSMVWLGRGCFNFSCLGLPALIYYVHYISVVKSTFTLHLNWHKLLQNEEKNYRVENFFHWSWEII